MQLTFIKAVERGKGPSMLDRITPAVRMATVWIMWMQAGFTNGTVFDAIAGDHEHRTLTISGRSLWRQGRWRVH